MAERELTSVGSLFFMPFCFMQLVYMRTTRQHSVWIFPLVS